MSYTDEMIRKTLEQIKEAQLAKAITVSTGLQGYDLEVPAKNLYPVLSPIRNMLPRIKAAKGSSAVNWKVVSALTSSGTSFVGEGLRNSEIGYTEADKNASYKSWGRDDSVTREAEAQAQGFEDLRARSTRSLMQRVMIEEEDNILGALATALGTTPTPVTTTSTSGGSIGAATYNVFCVALPFLGYRSATVNAVNAAPHALKSASAAQVTTGATSTISGHVAPVAGAVAYAWFIGTAGNEKCEQITTIANFTIAALAGTGENISAVAGNTSNNALNFDGILPQIVNGSGIVTALANGVDGTGTGLTYDSAAGIVEFDAMLKSLWNSARVSPDLIYMNAQEMQNVSKKILAAGSQPIYHINVASGTGQAGLQGSARVTSYLNKFTGDDVAIRVHPTLAPGTVLFLTLGLPAWYPNTNVEGLWDMHMLEDYYEIVYAQATRKWEHGVYANGVLRGYMPTAQGIINNIANA
jgi:hypothetical protein